MRRDGHDHHDHHDHEHEILKAGSAHAIGAWLFLAASLVTGGIGVMRMMSPAANGAAAGGTECVCLAVLFAAIAAVLALLGIHRQNTVLYSAIVPGFQGSHGSDDGDDDDNDGGI